MAPVNPTRGGTVFLSRVGQLAVGGHQEGNSVPLECVPPSGCLQGGNSVPLAGTPAITDHVVSNEVAAKRPRKEGESRARSIELFADVARTYMTNVKTVKRIVDEEGDLLASSPSLVAMFANKSTGTLGKRASSIKMYRAWFITSGERATAFFDEKNVFAYVRALFLDHAPPTRASALREAMNFLDGVFQHDLKEVRDSRRVLGMSIQIPRTKGRSEATKTIEGLHGSLSGRHRHCRPRGGQR